MPTSASSDDASQATLTDSNGCSARRIPRDDGPRLTSVDDPVLAGIDEFVEPEARAGDRVEVARQADQVEPRQLGVVPCTQRERSPQLVQEGLSPIYWGVCAPRYADAKRKWKRNFWLPVIVKSYVSVCVCRLQAVCTNSPFTQTHARTHTHAHTRTHTHTHTYTQSPEGEA